MLSHELDELTILIRPSSGAPLARVAEAWRYRELLMFFVWRDVTLRYKQTLLGVAWVILQPLLTVAVFSLFFGRLAKLPSDGLPYPLFYFAALIPWMYFAAALQGATGVVVEQQRIISKVYFPRVILPIAAVMSGLVDVIVLLPVLLLLIVVYGIPLSPSLLLLPILIGFASVTAIAVGLWLSALNAMFRDIRYLVPFVTQFWMLASPIAYPASLVPERWRWLYGLNPLTGVIEGFRWALTGQGAAPGPVMLASAGVVGVVLVTGWSFFERVEGTLTDVV